MKKKSTIIALTLGTVLSIQAQNVGINTDGSDPDSDAILHIKNHSGSSLDPAVVRIENEKANNETGVQIKNSGTTPNIQWNIYNPASGSTDLRISNNGTDRVTIQNDGDVGIGTTTPISGLDIQGSMGYKINTINTTTILDNTYNVVICNNGDYDVILPAAASNTGRVYYIKNNDSGGGVFTIDGNASETINGSTTYDLDSYTHVVQIISDGTNWHIIEEAKKNAGTITGLTCGSSTDYGTLQVDVAASGVNSVISYTGGNGAAHPGQTVASTGVTGLTATLSPGTFASGAGSLTYNISGTPSGDGTASFAINIGGQTCTLDRTVDAAFTCGGDVTFTYNGSSVTYGTVSVGASMCFMDRNLGALRVAQGANPSQDFQAYGDLFQWGRADDGHQVINWTSSTTSDDAEQSNESDGPSSNSSPGSTFLRMTCCSSTGYNWYSGSSPATNDLWKEDGTGVNNPCPDGWRVPTYSEWSTAVSTLSISNASTAATSVLKLPLAGLRNYSNGSLGSVGAIGVYWSSTVSGTGASNLGFGSSFAGMYGDYRSRGFSVRCLKD